MARDDVNGDTALHFAALTGHAEIAETAPRARGRHRRAPRAAKEIRRCTTRRSTGTQDDWAARPTQGAPVERSGPPRHPAAGICPHSAADTGDRAYAVDSARGRQPVRRGEHRRCREGAGADRRTAPMSTKPGCRARRCTLPCRPGMVGIAVMLIDAGADLEVKGDPGEAHPLHLAAYGNRPEAAQLLLDRPAPMSMRAMHWSEPRSVLPRPLAMSRSSRYCLSTARIPMSQHWNCAAGRSNTR